MIFFIFISCDWATNDQQLTNAWTNLLLILICIDTPLCGFATTDTQTLQASQNVEQGNVNLDQISKKCISGLKIQGNPRYFCVRACLTLGPVGHTMYCDTLYCNASWHCAVLWTKCIFYVSVGRHRDIVYCIVLWHCDIVYCIVLWHCALYCFVTLWHCVLYCFVTLWHSGTDGEAEWHIAAACDNYLLKDLKATNANKSSPVWNTWKANLTNFGICE